MPTPNFIIIGAARSGTTALYYYLMQHPDVFLSPVKETNYFALDEEGSLDARKMGFDLPGDQAWIQQWLDRKQQSEHFFSDWNEYVGLFDRATHQRAIGEASPSYLYSPLAPERIHQTLPHARLIAILRHPVDRAYSQFIKHSESSESTIVDDFTQILDAEYQSVQTRRGGFLHHWREGLYHEQLQRYTRQFDSDQIHICLYDDLCAHPTRMVREIYAFLGVDRTFTPEVSQRINASGIPKIKVLDRILNGASGAKRIAKQLFPESLVRTLAQYQNKLKNRNLSRVPLPDEIRRELTHRYYRDDILKLQALIQRDLSSWLQ